MKKNSLLVILVPYIIGILIGHAIQIDWLISLSLWVSAFLLLIILTSYGRKKYHYRFWISINTITAFLFMGLLNYNLNNQRVLSNHFSEFYVSYDQIIGKIIDYQEGSGNFDKVILSTEQLLKSSTKKEQPIRGKLLCYIEKGEVKYSLGDYVQIKSDIIPIKNKNNPGEFDAEKFWAIRGITEMSFVRQNSILKLESTSNFHTIWYKSREYLKKIIAENISAENQGLVVALTLGDKSEITQENKENFSNAGAMHVLAVSGMHVGILLFFLEVIFKRIKVLRQKNLYLIIAIFFLWMYAFLTGLPASVFRAVLMFSILAIGKLLGKNTFSLQSIFASALIILIINPLLIYDVGFQLSYLAVVGISVFFQPISNLILVKNKWLKRLWEGTALCFAAQIGTVPISLYYFNQFPNYFLLSNVVVLVFAWFAMISAVVFMIFHFVPYLSTILALITDYIFGGFKYLIDWINKLPFVISTGFTPSVLHIVIIYSLLILVMVLWNRKNLRNFNLGITILFFSCVGLVVDREQKKFSNELIIMNDRNKIIILKENGQLYAFFDPKYANQKGIDFLIHGYEIKNGVTSKVIPIEIGKKITSDSFTAENYREGLALHYRDKNLFLQTFSKTLTAFESYDIVTGSWSQQKANIPSTYSINEAALIFKN